MAVQHMISSDFTVGVHGEKGVCVCVSGLKTESTVALRNLIIMMRFFPQH